MIDAIQSALRFAAGRSREDLNQDEMFRFALTRAVEILGEAANKVSLQGRAEADHLPWRQMVGMRNRVVHAYFDIDPDVLWATVTQDLPQLLPSLQSLKLRE